MCMISFHRPIFCVTDRNIFQLMRIQHFRKCCRKVFFCITEEQVLIRCRVDASQYLTFLKYCTHFMVINAILCICFVLPTNWQGQEERTARGFERTTITNLGLDSRLLWVHVVCSCLLLLLSWVAVRAIFLNLRVFNKSRWTEKTVIVRGIGKKHLTSEAIEAYFKKHHPKCTIEDIKLVYRYRRLLDLDYKLMEAEVALNMCDVIRLEESREVMVNKYWWFCYRLCNCHNQLMDGRRYYEAQVNKYKDALANELNRLPKTIFPIAFITFERQNFAEQVLSSYNRFTYIKTEEMWQINSAPEPSNIIWANIKEGNIAWNFRTIFINIAVFLIAFFLTTPAIVISSFKLDSLEGDYLKGNVILSRFFFSVLVWILSASIPALVAYSSTYLEFKTKSSMYTSLMRKTVIFLIFTVVILPSLGLSSLSAFALWSMSNIEKSYSWKCIFLPDNGAFFADYMMTTTFIGVPIELLRLPELLYCFYYVLISQSEAEKLAVRKKFYPWEFSFGVQYSYALLIFSLTVFFSIPCPLLSVLGMAYFILKGIVDRYNIYFSCAPSQINHKIHVLAIKFVMVAMLLQTCGLFFLLYVRTGWRSVTYFASITMWINIMISMTTINPCNWSFIPPCSIIPVMESWRTYRRRSFADSEDIDPFHPKVLLKYIPIIQSLDKYNNPIVSAKRENFVS